MIKHEQFVTPYPFRLAFCYIDKPRTFKDTDSKPKYDIKGMMPKEDDRLYQFMNNKVIETFKAQWPKASDKLIANMRNPIKDGDEEADNAAANDKDMEFVRGMWTFKAASLFAPVCYDKTNAVTQDREAGFYPGAYVAAVLQPNAYDTQGVKGVNFYLQAIGRVADGEHLRSASADHSNAFAGVERKEVNDNPMGLDTNTTEF